MPNPTLRRVNRGNYHYYVDGDGRRVPGVTTILSKTLPKPALVPWAAKATATFAVDNLDTLAGLDRGAAIELAKKAPQLDRDAAARRMLGHRQPACAGRRPGNACPRGGSIVAAPRPYR